MMKLGTQTGSLVNHMLSNSHTKIIEIGMGVTILKWSDRTPATVTDIFFHNKHQFVETTNDFYKRIDDNGMSECQEYEYTPNPNGAKMYWREQADGSFVSYRKNRETGRWNKADGPGIMFGMRQKYRDFSF